MNQRVREELLPRMRQRYAGRGDVRQLGFERSEGASANALS